MSHVGRPKQEQYVCSCHGTIFATSKKKCTHEYNEKQKKSIAGSKANSKAGSQVGQEDQKMEDVNANQMLPPANIMRSGIGPKYMLPTSANLFGFITGETDASKLEGL